MNDLALAIADRVAKAELQNARVLGHDALECFLSSYRCFDDVLDLAFAPSLPPVLPRFRSVGEGAV